MMNTLRDLFLLDPEVVFLNHGSFGACPRPVFETYQAWQRELERQPVEFLGRRAQSLLQEARAKLAEFLRVDSDEVVYFSNPTTAVNMVARSLALEPGDVILATDHEYGAMDRTWRFICQQCGASYVRQPIPLPVTSPGDFVARFWEAVTPRTRAIFISHITSPTALIFPIREICARARERNLLTIVDGAHAPGQIPLDLNELGADLYAGACHKWMMAPKGAAFLFARREVQKWLAPLVVSWGYEAEPNFSRGSQFIDFHEWQGTRDLAAFLTVPAAIDFAREHRWDQVRSECAALARQVRSRIHRLTGLEPICPEPETTPDHYAWFTQMCAVRLPEKTDLETLKTWLYKTYCIEIPTIQWNAEKLVRISIQGYNSPADADLLVQALQHWFYDHPER